MSPKPSGLIQFTGKRLANKYGDRAARTAVMYPLAGALKIDKSLKGSSLSRALYSDTEKKTQYIIRKWRATLYNLRSANWPAVQTVDHYCRCLNCMPSLMVMDWPKGMTSLPCRRATVCPFCYARWVSDLYYRVKNVWLGVPEERLDDYRLMSFRYTRQEGVNKPLEKLFKVEGAIRLNMHNRLGSFASWIGCEYEPYKEKFWKITNRGIVLIDRALDFTQFFDQSAKIKVLDIKDSYELAKIVGWVARYPTKLMQAENLLKIARLLMAREHHRLYASYGLMRGKSK